MSIANKVKKSLKDKEDTLVKDNSDTMTNEKDSSESLTNVSETKGLTEIKTDKDVVDFNKKLNPSGKKSKESITLENPGPKHGLEGNPNQLHRYNRMLENHTGEASKYFHSK